VPAIRIERLQKVILQDAAEIISHKLRDPRLKFGSVTRVKLAEDLRHATIFVSCLGDEADRRTYMRALESARGRIQSMVAKHLKTRVTPSLAFSYDESVERSIRMSQLIDKARAEDEAARAARGDSAAPGGEASERSDRGEEE